MRLYEHISVAESSVDGGICKAPFTSPRRFISAKFCESGPRIMSPGKPHNRHFDSTPDGANGFRLRIRARITWSKNTSRALNETIVPIRTVSGS